MAVKINYFNVINEDGEPITLEEFIAEINLPFTGEKKGNEYVIELMDSNSYAAAYNLIANDNTFILDDDSIANDSEARFTFHRGNFEVKIEADFDDDVYRITIGER